MATLPTYTWLLLMLLLSVEGSKVTVPSNYTYTGVMSVNGSNATGYCSSVTDSSGNYTCTDPTSSVLFDGHIPRLDGDHAMCASQLFTIQTLANSTKITFDFDKFLIVNRMEVVMFNCPQWGIGVQAIRLLQRKLSIPFSSTSCDHLMRLCLRGPDSMPVRSLTLNFTLFPDSDWVHLAEVTFYISGSVCPGITTITTPSPAPTNPLSFTSSPNTINHEATAYPISIMEDSTLTQCGVCPSCSTPLNQCPSCSTSVALASALSAIITALLPTVIFVLVQIAVCKCHPKFTPAGAETGTSAGKREGQEYEEMDVGEGGVATSDPTYMEVGAAEGKTFALQQNEAYGTHTGK